ncbi:MAG: hypothetical protein HY712_06655 [candidate division NC10 bacterium]|nr:hypothetical protein [candidate division NC10 bacterium]
MTGIAALFLPFAYHHSPARAVFTKDLWRIALPLAILTLLMAECLSAQIPRAELAAGLTRQEVRDALGEPDEKLEFVMPDGPFFGPQEALSGLVPSGSLVEEWRYELNADVRYVWFYGDTAAGGGGRRLIATTTVPKDAVY